MRGPGSSPGIAMASSGQERLLAARVKIPILYCPLPNGDNDTLINTGPSIPIIGKWYPHDKWDSYCFFSQRLTKTNPAGPKFDHGPWVNIECCGVFLEEFNKSILEALMIGSSVAGNCTVACTVQYRCTVMGMGGRGRGPGPEGGKDGTLWYCFTISVPQLSGHHPSYIMGDAENNSWICFHSVQNFESYF